jgi:nitrate reductase delta subunit
MLAATSRQTVCRHFADLLDYPDGTTLPTAVACAALLRDELPAASAPFAGYLRFLEGQAMSRVEEVYTATFDLQPACHPYLGYQLCGESQQRALFLMQLQQLYRRHGYTAGSELPDHLATVLRFIAGSDDRACREELVADGLLPTLDKMLRELDGGTNPYAELLQALRICLAEPVAGPAAVTVKRQKEACS